MDEAAYVGDDVLHVPAGGGDAVLRSLGVGGDEQPGRLQLEDDAAQGRPETVVEVASDASALLLAGDDESFPALLELLGELAGPRGGGGLAHDVGQQPLVAAGQPAAQSAGRQDEVAHGGLPVDDGQRAGPVGPGAVGGHHGLAVAAVDLDLHEADTEGGRHRARDRGQLGRAVVGRLQASRRGRRPRRSGCHARRASPGGPGRGAAAAAVRRARPRAAARAPRPAAVPASRRAAR